MSTLGRLDEGARGADAGSAGQPPEIGVGLLGYAFMGRAHADAYRALRHLPAPPALCPHVRSVAGRDSVAVSRAASRLGIERAVSDWHELIADERIALFDNVAPNDLHAEPTIAAAQAGKHVVCEKPLGRNAEESYEMWQAVAACEVVHMCAFNYRFVPAVALARSLIASGELGEIHHFRARYLQDWLLDPELALVWRLQAEHAGSGALGDLGAHVIDLARFLVGEIAAVAATTVTVRRERAGGIVDVDDAFAAVVTFEEGAIGTIEASRVCRGRKNALTWEVNGSRGSLAFDLERLNHLWVDLVGTRPGEAAQGFREVLVTEPDHPYAGLWWPPGHILGWHHSFVHELGHLLGAIAGSHPVRPLGADFEDGYRAAEVCDAVLRSQRSGCREWVAYRTLPDTDG